MKFQEFLAKWATAEERSRVITAFQFYKQHQGPCGYARATEGETEARIMDDMKAIDFRFPVSYVPPKIGTMLYSFRDRRRSMFKGNWFNRGGFEATDLGILGVGNLHRGCGPRIFDKIEAVYDVRRFIDLVMVSTSAAVEDDFSVVGYRGWTRGGGEQILIPESFRYLVTSTEMAKKSNGYKMTA